MSLKQQIDFDIKKAMLAKNKDELTALRSIKSAILLAETEKGAGGNTLSNEVEMKLLTKAAKQRKESAELFQKEGREDLAAKEKLELEIISRYLPEQVSKEELTKAIQQIISQTGVTSVKEMGKVMGLASKQFAGKADGKEIANIVKQLLN